MTMYAVTATATWKLAELDGEAPAWDVRRDLPTFYLDSNTQGIVSEQHAQSIARELFDWLPSDFQVFVGVAEVAS